MNHGRKFLLVGLMLIVGIGIVAAAGNAEQLHQFTLAMNLSKQNMDSIVETYNMLDQQVAKEMEAAGPNRRRP